MSIIHLLTICAHNIDHGLNYINRFFMLSIKFMHYNIIITNDHSKDSLINTCMGEKHHTMHAHTYVKQNNMLGTPTSWVRGSDDLFKEHSEKKQTYFRSQ